LRNLCYLGRVQFDPVGGYDPHGGLKFDLLDAFDWQRTSEPNLSNRLVKEMGASTGLDQIEFEACLGEVGE